MYHHDFVLIGEDQEAELRDFMREKDQKESLTYYISKELTKNQFHYWSERTISNFSSDEIPYIPIVSILS